jgi:uncharacterized repeat protein (TIGR03803 family)
MKIVKRNAFFLVLLCLINNTAFGQFQKLHEFANDGKAMSPTVNLSTDGVWLYGIATQGGINDLGELYKVKTDGSGFATIMDFDSVNIISSTEQPLTIYNNSIYGVSRVGGSTNMGFVYKVNIDGTGFTHLVDFGENGKAAIPRGCLIVGNEIIYGLANGGQMNSGVIYSLNPDGSDYNIVHDFSPYSQGGYNPTGRLYYQNGFLYGVNISGGLKNSGTIFKVNIDGTQYSDIYYFDFATDGVANNMVLGDDNIIYGSTYGIVDHYGCLYKINTDGTNYTKLFDFDMTSGHSQAGYLIFNNNALFGECFSGAANDLGCIFEFNTTDSTYTKLREFDAYSEWNNQFALVNNSIYYTNSAIDKCTAGSIIKVEISSSAVSVAYSFNICPLTERHADNVFLLNNKIYGQTKGGERGFGTIFTMNPNGSGYTTIFEPESGQNIDSYEMITVEGNWFYCMGRTIVGKGCIFKIKSDGSSFTTIFTLDGINDKSFGQVFYSNGTFFCSTLDDGKNNKGKFFKVNLDGSGYAVLLDFDTKISYIIFESNIFYFYFQYGLYNDQAYISKIHSDGTSYSKLYDFQDAIMSVNLICSEGYLFGTSYFYGANNCGYIYKLKADGTEYSVLHNFEGLDGTNPGHHMICHNGYLYGMTDMGGADLNGDGASENYATIFRVKTDGSEFKTLLNFDQKTPVGSKGYFILSDNLLYVITYKLGLCQKGSLFQLSLDGAKFKKLVDFDGAGNGSDPRTLIKADDILYGCTYSGGAGNIGIIYDYKLPATGINDVSELEASIYPNPSSDGMVFVELNKQISSKTFIEIVNFYGQVLFVKTMQSSRDELDLTGFTNGMYMIRIRSDQTLLKTEKLILE